jgi:hypothetical protein
MRWLAAALGMSIAAFGVPAMASDGLPLSGAGLVPLGDAMLALTTGGAAGAGQFGATAAAGPGSVELAATSSLQASISHSAARLGGTLTTGDITLGDVSGVAGGMTSLQLSTGFNNIQQNSVALAFAF